MNLIDLRINIRITYLISPINLNMLKWTTNTTIWTVSRTIVMKYLGIYQTVLFYPWIIIHHLIQYNRTILIVKVFLRSLIHLVVNWTQDDLIMNRGIWINQCRIGRWIVINIIVGIVSYRRNRRHSMYTRFSRKMEISISWIRVILTNRRSRMDWIIVRIVKAIRLIMMTLSIRLIWIM